MLCISMKCSAVHKVTSRWPAPADARPTLPCHEQAGWLLSQICCTLESEGTQSCSRASDARAGSCKAGAQHVTRHHLMRSMRDQPDMLMLPCCCLRKDQQGLHIPPGALSYKDK